MALVGHAATRETAAGKKQRRPSREPDFAERLLTQRRRQFAEEERNGSIAVADLWLLTDRFAEAGVAGPGMG
jgi:hypothetical protein